MQSRENTELEHHSTEKFVLSLYPEVTIPIQVHSYPGFPGIVDKFEVGADSRLYGWNIRFYHQHTKYQSSCKACPMDTVHQSKTKNVIHSMQLKATQCYHLSAKLVWIFKISLIDEFGAEAKRSNVIWEKGQFCATFVDQVQLWSLWAGLFLVVLVNFFIFLLQTIKIRFTTLARTYAQHPIVITSS